MKKKLAIITLLTGVFICLLIWTFSPVTKQKDEVSEFVNNGNETIELSIERDSIYADGVDPNGVYNIPRGIIVDDTTAVEYAKLVLFPIYGKAFIEKERPYSVKLLNGNIWCITGSLPANTEGGVFSILINKTDGRVLKISHSK